ncbi:hypothetical protein DFJ74DRAFT_683565 [Hyaloraphidium curvatum]|nr:hypothetical protein DFJ74DRAFT_683565 [Hyaloraphidium curvatum]
MDRVCCVRRHRTIFFVEFRPSDTVSTIKGKLSRLVDGEREPKDMRLQLQKNDSYVTLDDLMSADAAGIVDDAVVFVTFRKDSGGWEPVEVPEMESLADDVEEEVDVKGKGRG